MFNARTNVQFVCLLRGLFDQLQFPSKSQSKALMDGTVVVNFVDVGDGVFKLTLASVGIVTQEPNDGLKVISSTPVNFNIFSY